MGDSKSDTLELVFGAILTAVVHGGFLAFMLFGRAGVAEAEDPVILPVLSADLLRWGEVMPDPGELPSIPNPAPAPMPQDRPDTPPPPEPEEQPPAPDEVVLPRDEPPPEPAPQRDRPERRPERTDAQAAADAPERPWRGEHNPNRPITDGPMYGSPDGFIGGTSLSESAQRDMLSRIRAQLQRAFRPPATLSDAELRRLHTRVQIRVSSEGQILGWDVVESSGNRLFDTQVEAMLNRFRVGRERLDLASIPHEGLRNQMIQRGFVIRFPD
ncbi:MAG: hypothetical protein EA398_17235 [Deltaproteobacteria bacterium]|nr:MAG: hypothetical protein EA398_17235 [Deltaproteobacteria bacterium]